MGIVGKIIDEGPGTVNVRTGEIIADIVTDKNFFQIRAYARGDNDRKNGSKQNIQLTREKAIELRKLLDKFIQN